MLAAIIAIWPHVSINAQHIASAPALLPHTVPAEAAAMLARPVTLQLDHVPLRQAIRLLSATAGVSVTYQRELIDAASYVITRRFNRTPLGEAFAQVLAGTSLQLAISSGGQLSIASAENIAGGASIRDGTVTGVISDARTGRTLRAVKIGVDGTERVTETAEDGRYRLSLSSGQHTIMVRLIGYARAVMTVQVDDGAVVTRDIVLTPSATALDQVVVTGTVIPTELKVVPNAITVITAKDIEQRGITQIQQLFRGDVPGLFAQNQGSSSNALFDEVVMFSRGATSLNQNDPVTRNFTGFTNPIKTYVDGVEMADPKYLSQIDPKSIERIEILTGPQASTIYGSNAINGVMQIFTKRGTTSTPQLTLNLLSGWVENNFSNALTPQHDYGAQLNGIEGRLSYNAGGSWNYMGPWTPAKQTARTDGFGGARLEVPLPVGRMTGDMTLRRGVTQNVQHGSTGQTQTEFRENGWYVRPSSVGVSPPITYTLRGQTLGLTLSYAVGSWWSHELGLGTDVSDTETLPKAWGYSSVSDTSLFMSQTHTDRRSLRYATTAQGSITSRAQATVTVGADMWQNLNSSWSISTQQLTGALTGTTNVFRQPGHNSGGFLQTQLGLMDRLFLTYGLRAEWNPGYGKDAQPNFAPRYGVAYTGAFGYVTAKLRASYGRSTRPPQLTLKADQTIAQFLGAASWAANASSYLPYYGGVFDYRLANPDLAPEHQQGGEGGLDLYFGTHGSLIITRYNQIVEGLILSPIVDSIRTIVPCPSSTCVAGRREADGYGYYLQSQYLNVANIRNQGWELQGNVNIGPLTTHGTYTWTKSRSLGVNPKYVAQYAATTVRVYQKGAMFSYLPEHTWALGLAYTRATSSVRLDVTGIVRTLTSNSLDPFYFQNLSGNIRLPQNQLNVDPGALIFANLGYVLADLMASHCISSHVDGVLQVQNLGDHYTSDAGGINAAMGRQSKIGMRIRW